MASETVHGALEALKAERDRLTGAIEALEEIVRGGGPGKTSSLVRKAGALARGGSEKPKRKIAPRGLLKKTIRDALSASRRPLRPAELRDRVVDAGYPVRDPKVLYISVYTAAKNDPEVSKTKDGFSLRKSGSPKAGAKKKKTAAKKKSARKSGAKK